MQNSSHPLEDAAFVGKARAHHITKNGAKTIVLIAIFIFLNREIFVSGGKNISGSDLYFCFIVTTWNKYAGPGKDLVSFIFNG